MNRTILTTLTFAAVSLGLGPAAAGQCTTIDFDSFSNGTVVGSMSGVTFSALPGTCGGSPLPVVFSPGSTSSGTKAIEVGAGCPDFGPDYLQMFFATPQAYVTFTMGASVVGTTDIRAYSTVAGGAPDLGTQVYPVRDGVHTFVTVGTLGGPANIRRIEIDSNISDFESIDTLSFDYDVTPPSARIESPSFDACSCGVVSVVGVACDSDGLYGFDQLEYRSTSAAPIDPWTLIGSFASPLCTPGTLYTWDTAAVATGHYYLRLTVENACGLREQSFTVVYVDKNAPGLAITSPTEAETICGVVEVEGSAIDRCPSNWSLSYEPAAGGAPTIVASGSTNVSCSFLEWDTTLVPDGLYNMRLTATDTCGNTDTLVRLVDIDNSGPCDSCPADATEDGVIDIADLLLVLAAWGNCIP